MVGAAAVTDWDDLADALAARGHPPGDVFHLPELDGHGRPEPTRSEPAASGHGESTSVQEP